MTSELLRLVLAVLFFLVLMVFFRLLFDEANSARSAEAERCAGMYYGWLEDRYRDPDCHGLIYRFSSDFRYGS